MHDVQDAEVVTILLGRVRHWRTLRGGHTGWGWMGGVGCKFNRDGCRTMHEDIGLAPKNHKESHFIKNIGRGQSENAWSHGQYFVRNGVLEN